MQILSQYVKGYFLGISLYLAILLLITSCSVFSSDDNDITRADLEELEQEIKSIIRAAPAEDVSQCKLIAFGSKPCGGPWSYKVYSSLHTNEVELKGKVARYNKMEQRYNKENGIISDCMLVGKPKVVLSEGKCTTVSD